MVLTTRQGLKVELTDEAVMEQMGTLLDKKGAEVLRHAKRVTDFMTYSRTENYRRRVGGLRGFASHLSCRGLRCLSSIR